MSFVRNVLSLLLTSAVVMPLGLLTSIVLARMLGPEQFGVYSVAIAFATTVVLVAQLGWASAAVYRIRRAGVAPAQVVAGGTASMLVVSVAAVGLSLAAGDVVAARLLEGAPREVLYLALVLVPPQLLARLYVGVARGIDRFEIGNTYQLAIVAGTLAAVSAALVGFGRTAAVALAASAVAHALATTSLMVRVIRRTGIALRIRLGELATSLRYSGKTYLQTVAGSLHEQVDIFLLAILLADPPQVAFYAVAVGIVNRLKLIPDAIATALFPHLSTLDPAEAATFATRATRHAWIWVLFTVLALGVASPLVIPLFYGKEFDASLRPLLILLPAGVPLTIYLVIARYFMAIDRQQITIVTQIASVALNVVLNLAWIPRLGTRGSALASLCSYGLEAALMTGAFVHVSGASLRDCFVPGREDFDFYRRRIHAAWTGLAARCSARNPRPPL